MFRNMQNDGGRHPDPSVAVYRLLSMQSYNTPKMEFCQFRRKGIKLDEKVGVFVKIKGFFAEMKGIRKNDGFVWGFYEKGKEPFVEEVDCLLTFCVKMKEELTCCGMSQGQKKARSQRLRAFWGQIFRSWVFFAS